MKPGRILTYYLQRTGQRKIKHLISGVDIIRGSVINVPLVQFCIIPIAYSGKICNGNGLVLFEVCDDHRHMTSTSVRYMLCYSSEIIALPVAQGKRVEVAMLISAHQILAHRNFK